MRRQMVTTMYNNDVNCSGQFYDFHNNVFCIKTRLGTEPGKCLEHFHSVASWM